MGKVMGGREMRDRRKEEKLGERGRKMKAERRGKDRLIELESLAEDGIIDHGKWRRRELERHLEI